MYVYVYVYVCMCVNIYMYYNICTSHTHTHQHTRTHTHTSTGSSLTDQLEVFGRDDSDDVPALDIDVGRIALPLEDSLVPGRLACNKFSQVSALVYLLCRVTI